MSGAGTSGASEKLVRHDRIVICVPCFNEDRWLSKTLESVRLQSMADFAVLVSDNGSTDRTAEIARDFAARDPRFHYHHHADNIGAAANFNFARDVTQSPFFMWLGAHDCIEPTYLERTLPPLIANPDISLSYAFSKMIDEDGRTVRAADGSELDFSDVTGERHLSNFPAGPVARYFHVVRCGGFCIPINNIIRRDSVLSANFHGVYGGDRVVLSHLAYSGPFHCVPEYLYLHRTFSDRSDGYMKRLTGNDSSVEDWREFIDLFASDLSRLLGRNPLKPVYLSSLRAMLKYQFVPDAPGLLSALVRSLGRAKRRGFPKIFRADGIGSK